MHYYEVAPNRIVRSNCSFFTYSSEKELTIGQIVLIQIGKSDSVGLVINEVDKPGFNTKPILSIIEEVPLPKELVKLALWMSDYYMAPLASVLQTLLPRGIQKKRKPREIRHSITKRKRTKIVFNREQVGVINTYDKYRSGTFLLHGVTGSGKTEIYIEFAKMAMNDGKSSIILVPEIALTSQLIADFSNHFDNLILTHSNMSEAERHLVWQEALNGKTPKVVIGPRSALFTPLKSIGCIILDEAHEPSYKQELSPKYSALRAASILGKFHNAKVVFGSATPSVIDRFLAEKSKNPILKLTTIARANSVKPDVSLVDMTKRSNFHKHRFLSDKLLEVKKRGYSLAVITDKNRKILMKSLENIGCTCQLFDFISTSDDGFKKPDSRVLSKVFERYRPEKIMFIGQDYHREYQLAQAFNIDFVAITSPKFSRNFWEAMLRRKELIYDNVPEFIDYFLEE
jgi:primosomal protein N' (replication factor Y)